MTISKLTRYPGKTVPIEIISVNPVLDDFLMDLDSHLLGAAKVRLQFLAEIKDHLLGRKDYFASKGSSEDAAMEDAVKAMGPVDELAKTQRNKLKKKFLSIFPFCGAFFGLFMGFFGYFGQYKELGLVFNIIQGLMQGVFFGLFMGWFMTFIWPERQLSLTLKEGSGSEVENEFVVQYGKWMRRLSYIITVLFVVGGGYFMIFGIAGFFNTSQNEYFSFPWWLCLLLGVLSIFDFFMVKLSSRRYKVNNNGIYVKDFLGKNKVFKWDNLKNVGLLGDRRSWLPFYWKKVKYAEFENEKLKSRRLFIYPDMINADRLFVLINKKVNV